MSSELQTLLDKLSIHESKTTTVSSKALNKRCTVKNSVCLKCLLEIPGRSVPEIQMLVYW